MQIHSIHLDTVDSTNSYAKEHASELPRDQITCITAEEQTSGRGRQLRKWVSPRGLNLTVTFFFRIPRATPDFLCLSHLMAITLCQVLQQEKLHPKIKWPNDLLLNQKKLSGVLCETILNTTEIEVILGIGINVNMTTDLLSLIDQPATSLLNETGREWNKQELLQKLQTRFTKNLQHFLAHGFLPFHPLINELLASKGKEIRLVDGSQQWEGICEEITKDGRLSLLLEDGKHHFFLSGMTFLPLGK